MSPIESATIAVNEQMLIAASCGATERLLSRSCCNGWMRRWAKPFTRTS